MPAIEAAGWESGMVLEIGCPYISNARATMLRKALDAKADVIVFLDHDVSFDPQDLLRLIQTEGDVVAGTYRYKREPEEYMGALCGNEAGRPLLRDDGCIKATAVPAGFLKITKEAVDRGMSPIRTLPMARVMRLSWICSITERTRAFGTERTTPFPATGSTWAASFGSFQT